MPVTAWTQDADFTSTDHGPVDADSFMKLVSAFPWSKQSKIIEDQIEAGKDWCPPGVGMKAGNSLLHLFQDDPGWMIHMELARSGRILGLIPKRPIIMDIPIGELSDVEEIVLRFFDDYRRMAHG